MESSEPSSSRPRQQQQQQQQQQERQQQQQQQDRQQQQQQQQQDRRESPPEQSQQHRPAELAITEEELRRLALPGAIGGWSDCLASLSAYVTVVDNLRNGQHHRLPENAEHYLECIHNNILHYMVERGDLVEVFEALLSDATVVFGRDANDDVSVSTRSGSSSCSADGRASSRQRMRSGNNRHDSSSSDGQNVSLAPQPGTSVESGATQHDSCDKTSDSDQSGERQSSTDSRTAYGTVNVEAAKIFARPSCGTATTLAVYHVPLSVTQEDLIKEWPVDGSYNFLHLRQRIACRGGPQKMAIINFLTPAAAEGFMRAWQGRHLQSGGNERLQIQPFQVQGRDPNLMLVLSNTPSPPVLVNGGERMTDEDAREMVQLAKHGCFLCSL